MMLSPATRAGRARNQYPWWRTELDQNPTNVLIPVATWRAVTPPQQYLTRIDTAIIPLGTGSFLTAIPDSTTVGGNQRSPSSVDMQFLRNNPNQVAGYITPGLGALGEGNALIAGRRNSIRSSSTQGPNYCAIVGGDTNFISLTSGTGATGTFIGGGTLISMIVNGTSGPRANIGGNTVDFGGNAANAANIGGSNITINNQSSFNLAGQQNTTSHDHAGTMGSYAATRATNSFNIGANNGDGTIGLNQDVIYVLNLTTSNATPTLMSTDNNAAGASNSAMGQMSAAEVGYFFGRVVASAASGTNYAAFTIDGLLYRVAGVLTLGINTVTPTSSVGIGACALALGISGNFLTITATGIAATTIRWGGFIIGCHRRG